MKKLFLSSLLLSGLAVNAQKQTIDFADKYAQTITAPALKEKLSIIANPAMEGRETATPGQRKAAAYIESTFQKLGLQPGTTGGYQMQFPIYQDTLIEANLSVKNKPYKIGESWDLNISAASNGNYDIKEIVYVSYGNVDSLKSDYKGFNVKGKWILFMEGPGGNANDKRSAFGNRAKIKKAIEAGAKGIFIMSQDFPKESDVATKGNMTLSKPANGSTTPVIYVSSDLAHEILGMNPKQLLQSIKNIPVGEYPVSVNYTINKRTLMLQSSNVIGIIPGTDKKDEYVVLSSHYDHLGKRGNEIFNGADDDGSGTTAIMQIAEAFSKAKNEGKQPRRTIVFVAFSGEEKGLLGSEFFADHPPFSFNKTTVNLNIDMVGRIDPKYKGDSLNYLYIIGDDKLSSDLQKVTDSLNKHYLKMNLDRRYNDLKDPNRYYYRSDHYNFAKKGVPVIFYFNGTHADYHKSSDTVDKINFDLMTKRVKLVYYTTWEMANRDAMNKRDIPLDK